MKEKFGIISIVILLLCSGLVLAVPKEGQGSNPITECNTYCNGTLPIAKWDQGNVEMYMAGYTVNVNGDVNSANWTSNPAVSCVVEKEGSDYYTYAGGTSGTINKQDHDISHMTFCGRQNQIPEFTTIAAGIALIGSGAAFVALRKKR